MPSRLTACALAAALALSFPALTGCSTHTGGRDYTAAETRQVYTVRLADVVDVRPVTIHGDSSAHRSIGGVIGSFAGALVGSAFGSGTGRVLASAGGAIAGGAAGVGAGSLTSKETGQQVTVRYGDGTEEITVQGPEPALAPGQRVRVICGADGSRRLEPAEPPLR